MSITKQNIIHGCQKKRGGEVLYSTEYNNIIIKKAETQV